MTTTFETIQFISSSIIAFAGFLTALLLLVQNLKIFSQRPFDWVINRINKPVLIKIKEFDDRNSKDHNHLTILINEHSEKIDNLTIAKLKSDICNEDLPITERVQAGEVYVEKLKLNGEVKIRHKINKEKLENELKKNKA